MNLRNPVDNTHSRVRSRKIDAGVEPLLLGIGVTPVRMNRSEEIRSIEKSKPSQEMDAARGSDQNDSYFDIVSNVSFR